MSESLRDTVASAFEQVTQADAPAVETPAAPAPVEAPAETQSAALDRARDEKGRFAAEQRARERQGLQQPPALKQQPPVQQQLQAPAEPAKPRYQRPSTWRKETWGVWDKLNANQPLTPEEIHLMAEEAIKRDSDFSNGVSTYKREWETAKPLIDAMAPFLPLLQQHNLQPGQWISNLGNAHRMLAMGSPQEKAARFAQLAHEYGVPLDSIYTLGQDGKLYVNQSIQQQAQAQQQRQPQDIEAIIEKKLTDRWAADQLAAFAAQKEQHPHYEEVKQTMLGLLQAGLADDLSGAYEAALRHPRHSAVYEAQLEQQRKTDEAAKAEASRKAVEVARKKAASPRSATPQSVSDGGGKKGLRSTIEEAFDSSVSGRV